jgi:hypothetical protein
MELFADGMIVGDDVGDVDAGGVVGDIGDGAGSGATVVPTNAACCAGNCSESAGGVAYRSWLPESADCPASLCIED